LRRHNSWVPVARSTTAAQTRGTAVVSNLKTEEHSPPDLHKMNCSTPVAGSSRPRALRVESLRVEPPSGSALRFLAASLRASRVRWPMIFMFKASRRNCAQLLSVENREKSLNYFQKSFSFLNPAYLPRQRFRRTRTIPFISSQAVLAIRTRLSGSSFHCTGRSKIR
jgi:hypothetical protein